MYIKWFISLVYVTFLAAGACLSWNLPSIQEQQVSPHRLPQWMYAVLAEESLTRHLVKHRVNNGGQSLPVSKHTDCISTSVIFRKKKIIYVSLLKFKVHLCPTQTGVHVYKWRKWHCKQSHSFSLTGRKSPDDQNVSSSSSSAAADRLVQNCVTLSQWFSHKRAAIYTEQCTSPSQSLLRWFLLHFFVVCAHALLPVV